MNPSPSINPTNISIIKPSLPTPSTTLTLSAIDSQPFLRFTIEYLLVFESHSSPPSSDAIKTALSQALVPYYPLAGRILKPTHPNPNLQLLCNSQGALFVEANAPTHTISDFNKPPPTVTHWRNLMSSYNHDILLAGAPPLVLQLTSLSDGGAALVMAVAHSICDGVGAAQFLNFFSDLVTGKQKLQHPDINPVPWDRHLLNNLNNLNKPPIHSLTHPEFQKVEDLCTFSSRFSREKLTPSYTYFRQTHIKNLKMLAAEGGDEKTSGFTGFEALAGHVWRSWAAAMKLPEKQKVRLIFSVNVRKRVKPELPLKYYGNGIVLGCAEAEAGELAEKGLGYSAGLVKRAKERVVDGFVRSVVSVLSSGGGLVEMVGVLILSQWNRMGMEEVDFGMGRPVHVSSVCCDRYCYLLPGRGGGDVKVAVAVPSYAVAAYQRLVGEGGGGEEEEEEKKIIV